MPYIAQFIAMKARQREEELTFQLYIAESIRLRGENKVLTMKLSDLLIPQKEPEKTPEQVKAVIMEEYRRIEVSYNGSKHQCV